MGERGGAHPNAREGAIVTSKLTLHYRPCPFFCPNEPGYFRSWADLSNAVARHDGLVAIDAPSRDFARGRWAFSGVVTCTGGIACGDEVVEVVATLADAVSMMASGRSAVLRTGRTAVDPE